MAKKEAKKENNKNKKSFFKDFKAELKKVNWPTPKQLMNNTVAVVTIVLITAVIVFVLDVAFEAINKHGVEKVKEVISASNENTTEDNTSEENAEPSEDKNSVVDAETEVVEEQNTETTENTENNAE